MGVAGSKGRSEGDNPLSFTIPSEFSAGRDVQKRILDNVTRLGYNSQCLFAIKLALEEALINAIKHGNHFDPKKKVHIQAKVSPRQLEVTIEDEGLGFRRGTIPDPTLPENIEKCSGRRSFCSRLHVQNTHSNRFLASGVHRCPVGENFSLISG